MLYPLHSYFLHMACGTHTCSSSSPESHSALGSDTGGHHTCFYHCNPLLHLPGHLNLLAILLAPLVVSPQTHLWSNLEKQVGGLLHLLRCSNPSSPQRLRWRGFVWLLLALGALKLGEAAGLQLWSVWRSFLQCRAAWWSWTRCPVMLPLCATSYWTSTLAAAEPPCWSLDLSSCGGRDAHPSAQCWGAGHLLCAGKEFQLLYQTWSWMSHLKAPWGLDAGSLCTCSLATQMRRQ